MTKQEILNQIEELKQKEKDLTKLPVGRFDICSDEWQERRAALEILSNLEAQILPHFANLFEHYALRLVVDEITRWTGVLHIGKVYHNNFPDEFEPVSPIQRYEELKALDERLEAGELDYIWHVQSNHFDDGGICVQAWFAEKEVWQEWQDLYDETWDFEGNFARAVPYEILIIKDFLLKYQEDDRILTLWGGPY